MNKLYKNYAKAALDKLMALTMLILLAPLLLTIYVLILFVLGRPVLFKQVRPGKAGRLFAMFKFRSMTDAKDQYGNLLPDEKRLTRFGRLLRATSLDELPELINVLKGEMSLVGPRPLLTEYLELYTPEQARRHEVKPGITGWAQVNGRNAIGWEEKFKLDVWYVDKLSLVLDIKILFLTLYKVIKRDSISATEHVTMPKFMGSKPHE